jgi:galactofuranose transport system substrate-binding protein
MLLSEHLRQTGIPNEQKLPFNVLANSFVIHGYLLTLRKAFHMSHPRVRFWLIPLLAIACLTLSSCGNKKSGPAVGFAQEGDENDWRTAETKSVQSEAAKRAVTLKFINAQGDLQRQINGVRDFITQRVDAIILAPKVETGWEPVLREAKAAKIPVILVDRGVSADPDLYTTLIASDFVTEGQRAAQWLADHTNGQEVNIVELEGSAGAAPAIDRKKGFDDEIAKHKNMHILASQDGNFTVDKGKEVMTGFLQKVGKDKINVVYSHNDNMALGAIQAIEEAGKKPGTDIQIVSIDGLRAALQAVLDKKINCDVECNPLLGPAAFDAVEAVRSGKQLPKRQIQKDDLFDQSNLTQKILDERKY